MEGDPCQAGGGAGRRSLDRFLAALRDFGPILAEKLPHHAGDVNELPDEVAA